MFFYKGGDNRELHVRGGRERERCIRERGEREREREHKREREREREGGRERERERALSYTHLRAQETDRNRVCRPAREKKKNRKKRCKTQTVLSGIYLKQVY